MLEMIRRLSARQDAWENGRNTRMASPSSTRSPLSPDADIERALHRTIKQVTGDFESLSFNTAIAALMELLNTLRASGRVPTLDEIRERHAIIRQIEKDTGGKWPSGHRGFCRRN